MEGLKERGVVFLSFVSCPRGTAAVKGVGGGLLSGGGFVESERIGVLSSSGRSEEVVEGEDWGAEIWC